MDPTEAIYQACISTGEYEVDREVGRLIRRWKATPGGWKPCNEPAGALRAGYRALTTGLGGRTRWAYTHRLIYRDAQGSPLPEGMVINHMNGDTLDNRIANLELVTPKQNRLHHSLLKDMLRRTGQSKLTDAQAQELRPHYANAAGEPRNKPPADPTEVIYQALIVPGRIIVDTEHGLLREQNGEPAHVGLNKWGYQRFGRAVGGRVYQPLVHRLIYRHHYGSPLPRDMVVNHKNGDKADNRLANLELVTTKQNARHSARSLGTNQGERSGKARLSNSEAEAIRAEYAAGGTTYRQLADEYGVKLGTIRNIIKRKTYALDALGNSSKSAVDGRRRNRGANHHRAVLTDAQAEQIRVEYANGGTSFNKLAAKYGVSRDHH